MPNASTGGTEDRASQEDARSPGTAPRLGPDEVRVDISGDGRTTLYMADGSVTRTFLVETRAEPVTYGSGMVITYTFENGLIWTVDRSYSPGAPAVARTSDFRFGPYPPDPYTSRRQWRPGGVVTGADFNDLGRIREVQCDCELCRNRRTMEEYGFAGRRRMATDRWVPVTDEYRRREERLQRERMRRREQERQARIARKQEAEKRAEETLKLVLLPDELKEYEKSGRIIVTGSDKRCYEIGPGTVSNVQLRAKGKGSRAIASLCCHPRMSGYLDVEQMPDRDAHIAQILYLRHDLKKFWDTANVYWHDEQARKEWLKSLTVRQWAREQGRQTVDAALDFVDRLRP